LFTIRESAAVADLAEGHSHIGEHFSVWLAPFIGWTAFIAFYSLRPFA
jgi:hypothetical protein